MSRSLDLKRVFRRLGIILLIVGFILGIGSWSSSSQAFSDTYLLRALMSMALGIIFELLGLGLILYAKSYSIGQ